MNRPLVPPKVIQVIQVFLSSYSRYVVLCWFSGTLYVTVLLLKQKRKGENHKKTTFMVSCYSKSVSRGTNKWFTFYKMPMYKPAG